MGGNEICGHLTIEIMNAGNVDSTSLFIHPLFGRVWIFKLKIVLRCVPFNAVLVFENIYFLKTERFFFFQLGSHTSLII